MTFLSTERARGEGVKFKVHQGLDIQEKVSDLRNVNKVNKFKVNR